MQTAAATISPSLPPLLRSSPQPRRPLLLLHAASSSSSSSSPRFVRPGGLLSASAPLRATTCRSILSPGGGSSQWLSFRSSDPDSDQTVLRKDEDGGRLAVRASSSSAAGGESSANVAAPAVGGSSMSETLLLGSLFGLWYLFNIYFNIYNKQVLKVFTYPLTITNIQFAVGSVLVLFMWTTNLYKRPKVSASQLAAILPLAIVHTMGNLFTNMSLGKVAVSFTHTIKAMEPFFSVVLSALFLGELPSVWIVLSLMPIVGGVALASLTEASFNWIGFWSAMASNVTFQSRNVLSKKVMRKKEESLDNINLFSIITIMSFFLLSPATLFVEGIKVTPSYLQSAGLNVQQIYLRSFIAALCFHAYQQVSYMILSRVSPVTHSVGNCVKRVVVIVTSVLFFRTPVSPINALGTGIALAGVFLYSRVKKIKPKTA